MNSTDHSDQNILIDMQNVSKVFPGVIALDRISLQIGTGTVHAIVGENGAGKSTLMKIILGIYTQDSGSIYWKGREVHFSEPKHALHAGLAMIHQELSTAQDLTVAENVFLGKEITLGRSGLLDKRKMLNETRKYLDQVGIVNINPAIKMRNLSVAQQQMCEIAKAISYDADAILMDEPTSAIAEKDVETLFTTIKRLVDRGKTIIYVSHKMDEIFTISEKISVFRDGKYIDTLETKKTNHKEVISLMVGREITELFSKEYVELGESVLDVRGLTRRGEFSNVSFNLRRGEILGVAGLMGAGRSEIVETLFGIRSKDDGHIFLRGREISINSPGDAIRHGFALLTEDRKNSGCFLSMTVRLNTCISSIQKYTQWGFLKRKDISKSTQLMVNRLSIKTPTIEQKINNLSGGNQQKVLLGRWLLTKPEILIVDEPTRGIDVGAKAEIHRILISLVKDGRSIIMISSEMPEILSMSDRIMVVSSGNITGILNAGETNQEEIMHLCTLQRPV